MDIRNVADRHLLPAAGTCPQAPPAAARVVVIVDEDTAALPCVQHATWMTVDMVSRLAVLVGQVVIDCPSGVLVAGNVVPFSDRRDLRGALLDGARTIGVVPAATPADAGETPDGIAVIRLHVGPGPMPSDGWRVHGHSWWGGVTRHGVPRRPSPSTCPVGPYVAACLAVGEVFREIRVDANRYPPPEAVFYDAWRHAVGAEPPDGDGPVLRRVDVLAAVAGVGAVGCAFAHTLWAWPSVAGDLVAADADLDGVDASNLNRGALFARADIGDAKAPAAARRATRPGLRWRPVRGRLEAIDDRPAFVVGAVDTPEARAAIQATLPYPLVYASTRDLRAEVVRCDPRLNGPCMRCHNPPRPGPSDGDLAARFLVSDDATRRDLARRAGVDVAYADRWAHDPGGQCGQAGERVLSVLLDADADDHRLFSVPHVSVLAGTLLAAETARAAAGDAGGLEPGRERAVFTFLRPLAATNGAGRYRRDPRCPQCRRDTVAGQAWRRRVEAHGADAARRAG